ncbi:phosphoglucosamine mutase [Caldicellulosiruptor saccharolyticus DSM 8903]|uniref:Phosphoglucosamine mutase n=1 Tax=Caldicellulosiruptor saccharolyticus (strain ATCC 43494 / DSM 8903 / Tp8T 6331) TaxID=351627 RepID=GLMM_CALS8|nr:phosphoglucosamine mutase [Caldicellulosiruptor saccharolyticus]A4XH45.1 RecName: Full=Phosphoglucosamine mutase [Caldicellulosiruptor saccharolyticus DSM 8903]ABP66230.1 phosphoglucosamine mutase [Caldicellulosiruptor saccharolyticus DSM 8903]
MGKLFGTDGVRGVANKELTCELAFDLGRAGAYVLTETKQKPKILIGKDTRISCDMLEAALCAGLTSVGADVYLAGVITTPAIAHLVKSHGFDAGIMISASHNPYEFNGIKFFNSQGFKLSDQIEEKIEDIILNKKWDEVPHAQFDAIGRINRVELKKDYQEYLKSTLNAASFKGFKIVIDCANGAASAIAPEVFEDLGAEVVVINNQPDGTNINKNCGSTHLQALQEEVVKNKADFGIAYDGDADRTLFVDEEGNTVDGDKIMLLLAQNLKQQGRLKRNTLVVTVMSNMGLFVAAKELGINLEVTKVGDRYVLEKLLEGGYSIGGEQSGHIILLDYATTGDGILTSLQLTKLIRESGKKLSELGKIMKVYPQVLVNAKVENGKKDLYSKDPVILEAIKKVEEKLNGKGRVLIRPSGTEPLIRVMIEGEDYEEIKKDADNLASLIESRLS